MFNKIAICSLLCFFLSPSMSSVFGQEASKEDSLVLRFTGPEAQKLTQLLKERGRRETDFGKIRYYGDVMSLACSEYSECYLWLTRKEWQTHNRDPSALTFTLPLKQTTWSGQVSISGASQNQSTIQLQLEDRYYPGSFSFTKPLNCTVVKGKETPAQLQGSGDCRLELSTSPKKSLPYAASIQFISNLDNIVLNFKGPWARKLFTAANTSEVDPQDSKRIRAQLGPGLYCWNLDPLEQDRFLDDPYVCQANFLQQVGENILFSTQGMMKEAKEFSLTLNPTFHNGIVRDFELLLHAEGKSWLISRCPNAAKNAGYGQCSIFYDMKIDAGHYPIGYSVQGVAVGWGIKK